MLVNNSGEYRTKFCFVPCKDSLEGKPCECSKPMKQDVDEEYFEQLYEKIKNKINEKE